MQRSISVLRIGTITTITAGGALAIGYHIGQRSQHHHQHSKCNIIFKKDPITTKNGAHGASVEAHNVHNTQVKAGSALTVSGGSAQGGECIVSGLNSTALGGDAETKSYQGNSNGDGIAIAGGATAYGFGVTARGGNATSNSVAIAGGATAYGPHSTAQGGIAQVKSDSNSNSWWNWLGMGNNINVNAQGGSATGFGARGGDAIIGNNNYIRR
jgi:hypothetical protein